MNMPAAVYNGWHETELERWLSDHGTRIHSPRGSFGHFKLTSFIDIPYPSPADRRDLENLVKTNWDSRVQKPLGQVSDNAANQWNHAKEWIFDS